MGRIKDKLRYPIKEIPVPEDYGILTDSETIDGITKTFLLGSIGAGGNVGPQNNRIFIIWAESVVSGLPEPQIAASINSKVNTIEVLYDQIPIIKTFSVVEGVVYELSYGIIGKGKGVYGVGGTVTLTSSDLTLINSRVVFFVPELLTPSVRLFELGEIADGDFISVINQGNYTIEQGDVVFFEFTELGVRKLYSFIGEPAQYGLNEVQMTIDDVFLVVAEDDLPVVGGNQNLQQVTDIGATTTNPITVNTGNTLSGTGVRVNSNNGASSSLGFATVGPDNMGGVVLKNKNANGIVVLHVNNTSTIPYFISLPNKAFGTYNLPLTINNVGADIDGNISVALPSGLEAINEGNGIGWRLIGKNPANFGNIGLDAVDFGWQSVTSTVFGATGTGSFNVGSENITSGFQAYSFASKSENAASIGFIHGLNLRNRGFGNFLTGIGHDVNSMNVTVVGQAANLITEQTSDFNFTPTKLLFVVGNGTIQNNDIDYTVLTRSNAFSVAMDGTILAPSTTIAGIDAEVTGKHLVTKEWVQAQGGGAATLTANQVGFGNASNELTGSPNLTYDPTTSFLTNNSSLNTISFMQYGSANITKRLKVTNLTESTFLSLLGQASGTEIASLRTRSQGDTFRYWAFKITGATGNALVIGDTGISIYDNSGLALTHRLDVELGRFRVTTTGDISANQYGSGSKTGTPTYNLSVDSTGKLIETPSQDIGYTFATLPATPTTGQRAHITDSSVAASGNFGAIAAGGGANVVPVFYDGTNWIIA